ncbi:RNA polymerase sigma factor [Saccharopolyspora shandongensis]|nr:sigma factor [Saccharopolyspora shandongensis]
MASLDEAQLVRRIARGDRAAFEELYRRTSPWLALRLRRRCADEQLVAEVIQETYLAVWRAGEAFAGDAVGGSAVGWLWTIAARRLVDGFRRQARYARVPAVAAEPVSAPAAEDDALAGEVGGTVGDALRRPTHPRLRAQTHPTRTIQKGHHAVPETLPRPQDLPHHHHRPRPHHHLTNNRSIEIAIPPSHGAAISREIARAPETTP